MHKVLSLILDSKKKRINVLKKNSDAFLSLIKKAPAPLSFKNAIKQKGKVSIIGEIKQASPSAGILNKNFSPTEIAKIYKKNNLQAISVVTEEDFFLGKINYIEDIKKDITIPVLRKDFILDKVQILESRAVGADAVLLIAGILNEDKLSSLYNSSKELGMDVLVEVHTEKELKRVLKLGADIIGINNRNLHTFEVDLKRSEKLLPFVPEDVVKVSESGISSMKDVLLLKGLGVDAILVGECLMRAESIEGKLKEINIDNQQ
ncbi:MAG: indole-3-glycerol phosphate synthase TrpC [Candidatus Omnitrophica bacterium]|nr:indole-3-glycerol phosphate synthase TrpC [Candidatus Omnitrophota bacterium]